MLRQNKNKRIRRFNKHQENFKNPYFKRKKKEFSWTKFVNVIFYGLIIFWLLAIITFLFYSNYFEIKEIEISDLKNIQEYEVRDYLYEYFNEGSFSLLPKKNLLFLSSSDLSDFLLEKNNFISEVLINKNGKNKISIQIIEKEVSGYWKSDKKIYSFDKDGVIINIMNDGGGLLNIYQERRDDGHYYGTIIMETLNDFPLIIDSYKHDLVSGDKLPISKEKLNYILEIFNYLERNNLFPIVSFNFADDIYNNLILRTLDGWIVYFSLLNDVDIQLNRLRIFYKNSLSDYDLVNLKYIDLRMTEKIFYK